MTKRSRNNIQVSENHSHKRIKQYGGAAAEPRTNTKTETEGTTNTKQIFKGDAMEKLNKLLDLDFDNARNSDGSYKFKFKKTTITEIQEQLEGGIKQLQDAIVELGTQLSSQDIARILKFDLGDNQYLLRDRLRPINLQLEYLDTKATITKIANEVLKDQEQNPLLQNLNNSFAKSEAFRTQVKALFGSENNIPISLIGLSQPAINTGWQQITNTSSTATSHISYNAKVFENAEQIDISTDRNVEQINNYFIACEKLQVYYNTKHNEIIELYNILRGIITIKLNLVNLILEILQILQINITRRGTETTTTIYEPHTYDEYPSTHTHSANYSSAASRHSRPSIIIRKPKFEEIQDKLTQQKTLLEAARSLFPPEAGAVSQAEAATNELTEHQFGGGASEATDTSEHQPINMTISGLSGVLGDEFTITNLDSNKIKPGQNIMITIPGNQQALLARFINSTEEPIAFNFQLIQGNEFFAAIIEQFNDVPLEQQKIYIDFIDYVIPDVETMQVITALKQISIVEKTLLNHQSSRMIPRDQLSKITLYANINSYDTDNLQRDRVEFNQNNNAASITAKQQQIERVILNCYDLQNLYLIKHLEFINLFKMILYFSDMYMVNISIFNYIILLFQTDTVDYKNIDNLDIIPGKIISRSRYSRPGQFSSKASRVEQYKTTVNLPHNLIPNLQKLLNEQAKATTSMIPSQPPQPPQQEGGANEAAAATAAATEAATTTTTAAANAKPVQSLENKFQTKIQNLIGVITYNYANLHELENKIGEQLGKIYDAKLFKAWLLVRIERLYRLLAKSSTNEEIKQKITQMIEEYTSIAEKDTDLGSVDISAYINKYSDLISSDYVLGKIKEEILLLPEQATASAPGEKSTDEDQNVITAKQDLLETLKEHEVCTLGNKAACDSYYEKSFAVLQTTLSNMGFTHKQINVIIKLDNTIYDKFAVNQIALYLLKNVNFDAMVEKVNAEITDSQSKTNIIYIINRILKIQQEIENSRAEEVRQSEAASRASEETARRAREEAADREATKLAINKNIIYVFSNIAGKLLNTTNTPITIIEEYRDAFDEMLTELQLTVQYEEIIDTLSKCLLLNMRDDEINSLGTKLQNEPYKKLLTNLRELFLQACSTVLKIRSSEKKKSQSAGAYIPDIQIGGYKWKDVISVKPDGLTLSVGDLCNADNIESGNSNVYGPFKAIYTPDNTQADIYNNIFGNIKINEADPQNLLSQLKKGKNVIIFGFGFSGSGKTYTLIEMGHPDTEKSMLDMFISQHRDKITSVEFQEIYPKEKLLKSATEAVYKTLEKSELENLTKRIKAIEIYRRKNLTICATPNNDNSSRSFLQITLNLEFAESIDGNAAAEAPQLTTSKLVFFDMPGTENTARIRSQFFGEEAFMSDIKCTNVEYELKDNLIKGIVQAFNAIFNICISSGTITHLVLKPLTTKTQKQAKDNALNYYKIEDSNQPSMRYEDTIIKKKFKEAIITITSVSEFIAGNINIVGEFIIGVSEAATLFFNGRTEKSIREFIASNFSHTKPISLKILELTTIENVVNNFLQKFIYKPGIDRGYAYFKLPTESTESAESTASTASTSSKTKGQSIRYKTSGKPAQSPKQLKIDNETKQNIKKIFDVELDVGDKIYLKGFNYDDLTFYTYQDNKFEKSKLFIKDINFTDESGNEHPMIKYFMILLSFVNSKKQAITIIFKILFLFIYKFVNFIVEQGKAIMTTLEHLKYFFLFNLGDKRIEEYNDKQPDEKKFKCNTTSCSNLLNDGVDVAKYQLAFKIGTKDLIEEVTMGGMQDYHLLKILQELRGIPNEKFDKFKTSQTQYTYPDLAFTTKPNARFIMFANMKAHANKDDVIKQLDKHTPDKELIENIKLICNAEIDTLEFAHSVASTTTGSPISVAAFASASGGAIKYSKAKKYLTSRMRKRTLKRLCKIKYNSIYSRMSKKY